MKSKLNFSSVFKYSQLALYDAQFNKNFDVTNETVVPLKIL